MSPNFVKPHPLPLRFVKAEETQLGGHGFTEQQQTAVGFFFVYLLDWRGNFFFFALNLKQQ